MGSGKAEKPSSKPSLKNPNIKKRKSLDPNRSQTKSKRKKIAQVESIRNNENRNNENKKNAQQVPASEQLRLFLNEYQSANGVQLSSLELESIKDTCIQELPQGLDQDVKNLGTHIKAVFGASWKETLCEGQLLEGKIDPGSPSILIVSASALRTIELLRGLRSLTRECHAAKLFSKHIKVEEQVSFLKNRVNIACGTPNRIKKLIDIEGLGLSRLEVIMLDLHTDVKGYSLLTLPQVRDEFWELYRNYFHHRLVQGDLRICLYQYGPTTVGTKFKEKKKKVSDEKIN